MPNKRKLEDNLNKVFNCKDIHARKPRVIGGKTMLENLINLMSTMARVFSEIARNINRM